MGGCGEAMTIKELPLTVRVYNILLNARISLVSELTDKTVDELWHLKGMGITSIADIIIGLSKINKELKKGVERKSKRLNKVLKKRRKEWVKQGWL